MGLQSIFNAARRLERRLEQGAADTEAKVDAALGERADALERRISGKLAALERRVDDSLNSIDTDGVEEDLPPRTEESGK